MTDGATYSWTLLPYNSNGSVIGTISESVSFNVSVTIDTPGTPTPLLPSGTAPTLTPTFSWVATEHSTHYTIRVSNAAGTVYTKQYSVSEIGCAVGTGTCFATPDTALDDGSSYSWSLIPYNSADNLTGTESSSLAFIVTLNTPFTPIPDQPVGVTATTTPTYSWPASIHSTHYTLQVSDGASYVINQMYSVSQLGCGVGTGTCSITPTTALTDGTNYTWTLLPYNSTDNLSGTISSSVAFSIDTANTSPGVPIPLSPTGAIADTTPTYTWSASANSTHYTLVVTSDSIGTVISEQYAVGDLGCAVGSGTCSITPTTALTDGLSYTWHLIPYNSSDAVSGDASAKNSFSVGVNTPATPIPLSPSLSVNTITPIYSWAATEHSTHYILKVSNSNGVVINTKYAVGEMGCSVGSGTCSIKPPQQLTDGISYLWTLTPFNETDNLTGAESAAVGFSVNVSTNVPGTPTPASPSNSTNTTTPTYTWTATSYSSHYTLNVKSGSGTILSKTYSVTDLGCAIGSGTCTITPTTKLSDGVAYSWTLLPYNSLDDLYGDKSVSVGFSVNTTINTPGTPVPASPTGTITTVTPTFSWNATANSTHYTLKVKKGDATIMSTQYADSTLGCSDSSGTCSVTPALSLSNETTYTWTILPYNSTDKLTGVISNTMSFTVSKTITLVSPLGSSITDTTPSYFWEAVSGASSYKLEVVDSTTLSVLHSQTYTPAEAACSNGTGNCGVTPTTDLGIGSFLWSVTATPNGDKGNASFSTILGPLAAPTIVSPISTTELDTPSPTFTWTAVADATYYTFSVVDSNGNTAASGNITVANAGCASGSGNCTNTPSVTLPAGQGTWYITAVDEESSRTSSTSSSAFTIPDTAFEPGAATPISPNGTQTTPAPSFTWYPAANATHYKIVVTETSSSTEVVNYTTSAAAASCGKGQVTCNLTFTTLSNGTYSWTVQSWSFVTASYGTKSDSMAFTIESSTVPSAGDFAISPVDTIYTTSPAFIWNVVPGSTNYRLKIQRKTTGSALLRETYLPSEVGCDESTTVTTCLATPDIDLTDGNYCWEVKAFPSMQTDNLCFTIPETSDITLTGSSVDENIQTQTKIGQFSIFSSTPLEDGEEMQFTLSGTLDGSSFQVKNNDELWTASGFSPNYELRSSYTILVTASNGETGTFTITVNDLNDTPTAIVLSNNDVNQYTDLTEAYTIGVLTATDEDTLTANLSHTFAITGGDDQSSFQIPSGTSNLQFVAGTVIDVTTKTSYSVEVTVTDGGGATYSQTWTIIISTDNQAPTDIVSSNTSNEVSINSAPSETLSAALFVGTLSVTDVDVGDTHTLAITGGADSDLFELGGTDNMDLYFKSGITLAASCPDPYVVEITATDSGGLTYSESFSITVVAPNEAPTAITLSSYVLPFMDRATSMSIGTLTTTDPNDACDIFTYTINSVTPVGTYHSNLLTDYVSSFSGADDQLSIIDADGVVFGVFDINITTTDIGGLSYTTDLTNISIGGFSVDEILDDDASHPTVAEMLAAAQTTYYSIKESLEAASTGDTVEVSEYEVENLIIGKVGQQFTTGNTSGTPFDYTTTDIVKQFHVDITPSVVTATIEVAMIDAMYNYLPSAIQSKADTLFDTLTPYANDNYTASVRFRIYPTSSSGSTISYDTTTSDVDLLLEDSLLSPNLTFTVEELRTEYNSLVAPLNLTDDSLQFFSGQSIPTSQKADFYFPGMVSTLTINTGSVTLTK